MRGLRAVLVALGTALTVLGALALRADSAGPVADPAALVALTAAVALAQWHLIGRLRHTAALLGGLVLTQVACQLALQALGGVGGSGLSAVLCCPPTPVEQDAGVVTLLTAQAGLALLVAQVVAASLTAVSLGSAHVVVLDAVRSVATSLREHLPPLGRLLALLRADVRLTPPDAPLPRRRPDALLPLPHLVLARSVTRRGPPRCSQRPPSLLDFRAHGAAVT